MEIVYKIWLITPIIAGVMTFGCKKDGGSEDSGGGETPATIVSSDQPDDDNNSTGGTPPPVQDDSNSTPPPATPPTPVTTFMDFTSAANSANDVAASGIVTFNLNQAATVTCKIDYGDIGGTAARGSGSTCSPGDDYLLGGLVDGKGTVEVLAGESSFAFPLTICEEDNELELDETIEVTFSNPDGCEINSAGAANYTYVFTIFDDENTPEVQFTTTASSGAETISSVGITVDKTGATDLNGTVDYTISGTAGAGDHATTSGTLTFLPGSTQETITITGIVDNDLDENDETVIVTLSNPVNLSIGTNTTYTYTINDDEPTPVVAFDLASDNGGEASSPSVAISISGKSEFQIDVNYSDKGTGSATAGGTDYTFSDGTITFAAETSTLTQTVPLTVIDDATEEGAETIVLQIDSVSSSATLGAPSEHTHTIEASDSSYEANFTNASSNSAGSEAGSPTFAIQMDSGSCAHGGLSVDYVVSGSSTATGGGVDYTLGAGTVTWAASDCTSKNAVITLVNDDAYEEAETVILSLGNPSSGLSVGTNSSHTYTIQEDAADEPTVEFDLASQSANEGTASPTVQIKLNLAGADPTERAVSVAYSVNGGSSASGSGTDYSLTAGPASIPAGSSTVNLPLTIVNDSIPDDNETVVIDIDSTTPTLSLGTNGSHTLTIPDSPDEVAPAEISSLAILMNSNTAATLYWTSGGGTTNGYRIAYQAGATAPADCVSGTQIDSSTVGALTRHQVTGLTASTQYSFRVCAENQSDPVAHSAGLTLTATVQASAFPPPCDATVSANANFSSFQSTLDGATSGTDGVKTICINDGIEISDSTANRLVFNSDHMFIRSSSGRAVIKSTRASTGALENSALYALNKNNISLKGVKIDTTGTDGYGLHADGSHIAHIDDSMIVTSGSGAIGVYLDNSASLANITTSTLHTSGDYAHAVYLNGGSSVGSIDTSAFRRDSSAADNAMAFFFDSDNNNYFDSSSTAHWNSVTICGIEVATRDWTYSAGEGSDPANNTGWSSPTYAAYNGSLYNGQTFPLGETGVASGGDCPASWTSVYTTILVPSGSGTRCLDGCHAAGQTNKWDLTTQSAAYTDGIAKAHFCTDCDPVSKPANCNALEAFLYKVVVTSVESALGLSGCASNTMPKQPQNHAPGNFTQAEVQTIIDWMEAGIKND